MLRHVTIFSPNESDYFNHDTAIFHTQIPSSKSRLGDRKRQVALSLETFLRTDQWSPTGRPLTKQGVNYGKVAPLCMRDNWPTTTTCPLIISVQSIKAISQLAKWTKNVMYQLNKRAVLNCWLRMKWRNSLRGCVSRQSKQCQLPSIRNVK